MYSPTLGRFATTDPIGFLAGDVNLYRYVGNHPTSAVDPTGLCENDANDKLQAALACFYSSSKNNFEPYIPFIPSLKELQNWIEKAKRESRMEAAPFKIVVYRKVAGVTGIFNMAMIKPTGIMGAFQGVPGDKMTIELKDKNKTKITIYLMNPKKGDKEKQSFVCHSVSLALGGPSRPPGKNYVIVGDDAKLVLENTELFEVVTDLDTIRPGDIVAMIATENYGAVTAGMYIHSFPINGYLGPFGLPFSPVAK
jgi:hypothetical protein